MSKHGMVQIEPAHFSNVIGAVQRTASLTGGAVRGLPGGVVIGGLPGVASFASSISDAQKEFQLGRVHSALERVRQLETSFNGITGRWNSNAMSVISSAKQGRQAVPLAKLNEVKNAQTRMQQLIRPAEKAFRDLVTALEHEVAMEGRREEDADDVSGGDAPEIELPGDVAEIYCGGARIELQQGDDGKTRLVPALKKQSRYFIAGLDPPRAVRLKSLDKKAIVAIDVRRGEELVIPAPELAKLIRIGVWTLLPKSDDEPETSQRQT
ncbi:hypothetical protein Mal15_69930 [Stieleria maiorica]|uniref:Uncharacterized protein n=1 Tax=Stieleria maiorica TaxID=2795974 RepID=A0A5B9MNE7_9BACT|nr:hypothetical protein [Stieleria maiorica]QEG02872.1 hypothetical protein Mal15_69930 [Stieleria maiorica]